MIKFEHTVLPSPEQMEFIIEGMRNPLDSWDKSDSYMNFNVRFDEDAEIHDEYYRIGAADAYLMSRLKKGGPEHRKFMRMMPVMVRITAPLYWYKEFDTYKIGTVRNSCSTMHTLHKKGVTPDVFSHEWIDQCSDVLVESLCPYDGSECYYSIPEIFRMHLRGIEVLRNLFNETHDKKYWYAMIQMLPDGFMMTANVSMNYEILYNQKCQRRTHKQDEWREEYMKWMDSLPYQFLLELPKKE